MTLEILACILLIMALIGNWGIIKENKKLRKIIKQKDNREAQICIHTDNTDNTDNIATLKIEYGDLYYIYDHRDIDVIYDDILIEDDRLKRIYFKKAALPNYIDILEKTKKKNIEEYKENIEQYKEDKINELKADLGSAIMQLEIDK